MFAVVRYNANGTLDTSFNGTGKVFTDAGGGGANGVTLQSDGKIIVVGSAYPGAAFAVVRYNVNGTLDTNFNGTGKVATVVSGGGSAASAAVQSDGKIVVAGSAGLAFAVVRYNANGSLDTNFNGTGKVTTSFGTPQAWGYDAALQSDGKIVVGGAFDTGSGKNLAVVRYEADGRLDTSFNGTGMVSTPSSTPNSYGYSVALQSDHKIVVAGETYFVGTPRADFVVIRYNADGSLDATFNGTGVVSTDISGGGGSQGQDVAIQNDGKIVVVGFLTPPGILPRFGVARYLALSPGPEIAVEQPPGTNLVDSAVTVSFGGILPGATSSRTFAIQNYGMPTSPASAFPSMAQPPRISPSQWTPLRALLAVAARPSPSALLPRPSG